MKVHFMGITGSGIAGVAKLAESMGYQTSGCDLQLKGHNVDHLRDIDLLVISPAILYQGKSEPEFLQAKKKNIVMTWEEFLGKIILNNKKIIAIAGTHGKSTTTAMAGKMLEDAGYDPIVVMGANYKPWGGSVRIGKGDWAVVEADEFNDNFLNYSPDIIVINNIEFDHPEYFNDKKQVEESFKKFIKNLKGKKILVTRSDLAAAKIEDKKFNLRVMGDHNQMNARMVYKLGQKLGIRSEDIIKSLESFEGVSRRMELIGKSKSSALIYDDYAHHPTAIKITLEGLRKNYPNKKILAIIEPHGYKRTKSLLNEYNGVFNTVDKVLIGPIFAARDVIDKSVSPIMIAEASKHKNIEVFDSIDELIENYKLVIGNYSVAVVMGAGKSNIWAKKLLEI